MSDLVQEVPTRVTSISAFLGFGTPLDLAKRKYSRAVRSRRWRSWTWTCVATVPFVIAALAVQLMPANPEMSSLSTAALLIAACVFLVGSAISMLWRGESLRSARRGALVDAFREQGNRLCRALLERDPDARLIDCESGAVVAFSPKRLTVTDLASDAMIDVEITAIRRVDCTRRRVRVQRAVHTGVGADGLFGAMIGGVLFGGTGAVVGAIIGSSSGHAATVITATEQASVEQWVVDVFTRWVELPVLQIACGANELGAKTLMAVIEIGIEEAGSRLEPHSYSRAIKP